MISIYPDLEALSWAAAGILLERAVLATAKRSRFSVALSGGSTPQRTYQLLAAPPFREQVPWSQVHIFWGDERCVPLDDPRSNANRAYESLLNQVPIHRDHIYPCSCARDPAEAAKDYERQLKEFFQQKPPRFDLIYLGLGADGHTASLFPGTSVLSESERWVSEVYISGQEFHRVTLTVPVINSAAAVVFLVSGDDKARMLRQVHEGPEDIERIPAQLIKPIDGELFWLVDRQAAGDLKNGQPDILR